MVQDESVNADAIVRFTASKDYMKVGIARYVPHKGTGRPLSVDLLAEQLSAAGIQVTLDVQAGKKAVARLLAGEDISRIVVARGVKPVAGTNGRLACFGDECFPVFPDMAFGSLLPPIPAQPGIRIDGKPVDPPLEMQSCELQMAMHSNCAFPKEGGQLVAQVYGTILITGCVLQILPLVTVSKDQLRVLGTLYHRDCLGMPITLERVQQLLTKMGVVAPLNEMNVRNALLRAAETGGAVADVELARGVAPRDGTDGCLELLFDTAEMVGTVDASGAIDYKARGSVPVVCEGDPVAMLYPPTEGTEGKDVFGEAVPPAKGNPVPCVLCPDSILVDEDGITLQAKVDGVVQHSRGRLSVQDLFVVNGDVGMETGNIELERAALLVHGNVLSGFSVYAPQNVTVQGVVEAAFVHVGGDFLAGGLVLQKHGSVVVEGSLNANFINEGVVEVVGNALVKKSIDNTMLLCNGFVALGHSGRIVGGIIRCKGGLRAGQLGNTLGVKTHIIVELDLKALEDMEEEVLTKTAAVKRINQALGTGSDEDILKGTRQDKYKAVEKLLMIRQEAATAAKAGKAKLIELKKQCCERLASVSVQVSGTAYPGTIVTFEKYSFVVSSPISQCEFRLSSSGKSVELRSLGKLVGVSELSDDD